MFEIRLRNGKTFECDSMSTIFEAARRNRIILEYSCLSARCRSCVLRIVDGTTKDKLDNLVLTSQEKSDNWILSCNAIPTSNVVLDVEDLGEIETFEKRIIPAKIESIIQLNASIIEIRLRLPPNLNFKYNSGQYVNITKGDIKRSYSIANAYEQNAILTFFVKKYENGLMSNYFFNKANVGDLLRIEGPLGSFFLRENEKENIVFLATGTGIAPIKSILENLEKSLKHNVNKNMWLFVGARFEDDLFWNPSEFENNLNLKYIPVLSRASKIWQGERGYVQDVVLKINIPLSNTQVYACGSNKMIEAAKKILIDSGLSKNYFFSDVFVQSN